MQLYYFATALDTEGQPPVLTIASNPPAPGSTLQAASIDSSMVLWQLWSLTPAGQLVSACNSTLALSIGENNALIVDALQPG